ncbi:NAD(P)-binding domain-containing protein, partial [Halomonas sp. FL8]|nr:NAD(P)-binding domain-containing protein [Halomonas sp. FL8]
MKNTTLILGCGDIGTSLGRQLVDAGHRVIGVRRNPQP